MSVNYHSGNFRNKLFDRMMSLNEYLDVTLSVGRRTIHAHCCILAAGSSYFHTILKESIAGNKKPTRKRYDLFSDFIKFIVFISSQLTVVFTDIKYEHLQKIVEYLYTGEIKVQSTEIEEFLSIAKKLKIIGLYEQTESDKLSDSVSNISAPSLSVVYELDSNQNELQNVGQMGANGRNQSQNPIENQINMRTMASTSTQAIFPMASTSNPILSRNCPRSEPNLENLKRNVVQRSVSFLNRSQATVKTVIREKSAKQPSNQSNRDSPMTNRNGEMNKKKH